MHLKKYISIGVLNFSIFIFLQKYYFTVTAVSVAGTTTSTSDGVTIVTESDTLSGVMIYDGIPCNMTSKYLSIVN